MSKLLSKRELKKRCPLKKRKILKKSFLTILYAFGFLAIFLALFMGADRALPSVTQSEKELRDKLFFFALILTGAISLARIGYETLYLLLYYYEIDDRYIIIRKGVITSKEITLPFSRISDVYVDQDFMDVVLGLYDVHISTPTAESGEFAHIDGVGRDSSAEIRRIIMERIDKYQFNKAADSKDSNPEMKQTSKIDLNND